MPRTGGMANRRANEEDASTEDDALLGQADDKDDSRPNEPIEPYVLAHVEMKEFTLKAGILGSILAIVMAAANTYLGLLAGQVRARARARDLAGIRPRVQFGGCPRARVIW